ncbi:MAG: GTP-binding protein [Anaerolineae bacterium]|nr:GTP-binding protein [Anaerolineae bacterium]
MDTCHGGADQMGLPTQLRDSRSFIQSIDLQQIETQVSREAQAQIAIVGPVNSGKSTLFNQLKGQKLSKVSAVPGTTTTVIAERFGPFALIDTPGFDELSGEDRTITALSALDAATVAVLVLDASAGIRQSDFALLQQIRARGIPVVIVLNKIDLLKKDTQAVIADAERKIRAPIIPISAKRGTNIARLLIPALIDADPRMAVTIGRALPRYRRMASRRIITQSAMVGAMVGFSPVPLLDIPFLIGLQVRMLLRLAVIYGEAMPASRARELIPAIAGGLAIRYAAQELVKVLPVAGWITSGIVASTGTTAIGNAAILFFENSRNLSPAQLREAYKQFRRRRKAAEAELLPDEAGTPAQYPENEVFQQGE